MKIGIFGRGRLAGAVRAAALEAGHEVSWSLGKGEAPPSAAVDIAVDCSLPAGVAQHLDWALQHDKPLIIGVTAIDPQALAAQAGGRIGLLIAPNFSLSIALVARLAAVLARYADVNAGFDPFVMEKHHAKKADAPSGTARMLATRMLAQMSQRERLATPGVGAPALKAEDFCVSSVRAGSGTQSWHLLGIDSADEAIEIRHEARTLKPCGVGAVKACEFLAMGPKRGLFSMEDVARHALDGVLGGLQ